MKMYRLYECTTPDSVVVPISCRLNDFREMFDEINGVFPGATFQQVPWILDSFEPHDDVVRWA